MSKRQSGISAGFTGLGLVYTVAMSDSQNVTVPVSVPDHVVADVAEELEEIGVEPTRENIRDRVYDRVLVEHELVDEEEEPVVDRVANAVA